MTRIERFSLQKICPHTTWSYGVAQLSMMEDGKTSNSLALANEINAAVFCMPYNHICVAYIIHSDWSWQLWTYFPLAIYFGYHLEEVFKFEKFLIKTSRSPIEIVLQPTLWLVVWCSTIRWFCHRNVRRSLCLAVSTVYGPKSVLRSMVFLPNSYQNFYCPADVMLD